MAKKTLGYVELEWECPSCGSRNPGPLKKCANCGAAQPEDVEFVQPAQEEFVTDEAEIAAAKAGPDIHCAYCGTRNEATRTTCKQCGADLTEGRARKAGRVIGAHRAEPAPPQICPACGAENPANARKCSQCGETLIQPKPKPVEPATPPVGKRRGCSPLPLIIIGIIAVVVAFFALRSCQMGMQTTQVMGEVSDVNWQRTVVVQGLVPVSQEGWREDIPSDAQIGQCRNKVHHVQDEPTDRSREVCGTPYTVDTGTGLGEVVQDCRYEVYADWCTYQVLTWRPVDTLVAQGRDLAPYWPTLNLGGNQQAGDRSEQYTVTFNVDGELIRYRARSAEEYQQFQPGSQWNLVVNGFGSIVSVSPR